MNLSGRTRFARVRLVFGIGALTMGIATWSPEALGQYYRPSGGSRNSVSLRSTLMVGQGPSTINTMNIRAYSTGLGDIIRPTQSAAGGVLSSSVYSGNAYNIIRPTPVGPTPVAAALPPPRVTQSRQVYTPAQPVRFTAAGAIQPGIVSVGSLVVPPSEPAARRAPDGPETLPSGRIMSLVPTIPGDYRDRMAAGEKAFRNGDYAEAFAHFEKARLASDNSPECLLGLTHASLAMAKESHGDTARYLAATIKKFPYLPMADVNPRDFFGQDGDYEKCVARLEKAVEANKKDGSALLVLGYLKMRDNLFPVATRLLTEAGKVTTDREQAYAIDVLLKALAQVRQNALADAPKLAPAVELPWAGLKLAVPEQFVLQAVSDPNQFLCATPGGRTTRPQMINGFAYAVDKDVTPRMTLDRVAAMTSGNPAVLGLTQLEEVEVPYLGTTAVARLYSCQYADESIIAVRLCFAREVVVPNGTGTPERLMYVLGMALLDDDVEDLLPTFSAMARSVSLVEWRWPADLLRTASRSEVKLADHGFTIGQPQGWTGRRTPRGYEMSATDFGLSAGAGLQAQAMMVTAPGAFDGKGFGQKVIQDRTREGQRISVVSEAPARFAGLDGHEFLVRRTVPLPVTARAESRPAASGEAVEVLEIARLVCVPAGGGQTKAFAMTVRSQHLDERALRNVMDSLAGEFKLVKP